MRLRARAGQIGVVVGGLTVGVLAAVGIAVAGHHGTHAKTTPSATKLNLPAGPRAPHADTSASATLVAGPPVHADTPRAAIEAFLGAEAAGHPERAYPVLASSSLTRYSSVADWVAKQATLLLPVSFTIGGDTAVAGQRDAVDVQVTETHRPSLDPFAGLVPGRTRQVLRAVHEIGSWRVLADAVRIDPVFPDDTGVVPAVRSWVDHLEKCDGRGAAALEASRNLVGSPYYSDRVCKERGTWKVTGPIDTTGVDLQPFVSAYGSDVAGWGRVARVEGPHTTFDAAVAPIGDAWRVMGVLAAGGATGG